MAAQIFGIVFCDERQAIPGSIPEFDALRAAMAGMGTYEEIQCAGAGCIGRVADAVSIEPMGGHRVTLALGGWLAGRGELLTALGLSAQQRTVIGDEGLVRRAFLKWGSESPARMSGQWTFAAWEPAGRHLLLARSAFGDTPLFYISTRNYVAFASSLKALLALPGFDRQLDDLHLAQTLTSWPIPVDSTSFKAIRRLPAGHILEVTPENMLLKEYWDPNTVTPLRLRNADEYAEGFRDVWSRAVEDAIDGVSNIGLMLSGGLDSGALAAAAVPMLRARGQSLVAFHHVPVFSGADVGRWRADERHLARATAGAAGIHDLELCESNGSPIVALRQSLALRAQPSRAAGNQYWLHDLRQRAQNRGITVLLNGAGGNASISWDIPLTTLGVAKLMRRGLMRQAVVAGVPRRLRRWLRAWRNRGEDSNAWLQSSAINHDYARRLGLVEQRADALRHRSSSIMARTSMLRSIWLEGGDVRLKYGLEIRRPTIDDRVIRYCFSLPPSQWVGPSGESRWLVRHAMRGMLPAQVLENSRRGLQSADLVYRLRAHASHLEEAMATCASEPAVLERLDLPRLRTAWKRVSSCTDFAAVLEGHLLLRGLLVGLFLASEQRRDAAEG